MRFGSVEFELGGPENEKMFYGPTIGFVWSHQRQPPTNLFNCLSEFHSIHIRLAEYKQTIKLNGEHNCKHTTITHTHVIQCVMQCDEIGSIWSGMDWARMETYSCSLASYQSGNSYTSHNSCCSRNSNSYEERMYV